MLQHLIQGLVMWDSAPESMYGTKNMHRTEWKYTDEREAKTDDMMNGYEEEQGEGKRMNEGKGRRQNQNKQKRSG